LYVTEVLPNYTVLTDEKINYLNFSHIETDDDFIYLYLNKMCFLMVSKLGFDSKDIANSTIEMLTKKFKGNVQNN